MAANVESMFYAGERPWHGLGVRVPAEVPSREAIIHAGLDWSVETRPVFAASSERDLSGAPTADKSSWTEVPHYRAVVRTRDAKPLGIVGDRYRPIQNADAFGFFDAVVGDGQAIYHTAGSLDGGRKVWILAQLPGDLRVGDDITQKFILLMNSHDGSTTLRMLMTPICVVCQNTLNLAMRGAGAEGLAIRHTASAMQRIDEARRALGLANSYYDEFQSHIEYLAAQRFTDGQMVRLAEHLFPGALEEPSTRTLKARNNVIELFAHGRGHQPIRGTAFAALNAVAEYVDHARPVRAADPGGRQETRLTSSWLGSGAALKRAAHVYIEQQLAA